MIAPVSRLYPVPNGVPDADPGVSGGAGEATPAAGVRRDAVRGAWAARDRRLGVAAGVSTAWTGCERRRPQAEVAAPGHLSIYSGAHRCARHTVVTPAHTLSGHALPLASWPGRTR